MADEIKPNGNEETGEQRLDRIERALKLMLDDHIQFRDEHKLLLSAQVQMHGGMETLRGGLETLRGEVTTLTRQVGTLTSQMGTLTSQMGTLTSQMGTLTNQMGTLTSHMGTLTGKLDVAVSEFREFGHQVEIMRKDFDYRLRRLEG